MASRVSCGGIGAMVERRRSGGRTFPRPSLPAEAVGKVACVPSG